MFSYFWTCTASDLSDHSDSVPLNMETKWELCIGEPLILVMDLQWIVVCLFELFLTWGKYDYFCRLSVLSPLCCLSTGLSTFGDLLLKLCNISGFRMQVTVLAPTYKTSGCFFLRALFRKRRALSVHGNVTAEEGLAFQLLSIHLLQVAHQLHSADPMSSERSLRVSRTNLTPRSTAGLAPQGTNSPRTAVGISKGNWAAAPHWMEADPGDHSPAACGVTCLCRHELGLCLHWKISFFLPDFLFIVVGSYSVSCGVQGF